VPNINKSLFSLNKFIWLKLFIYIYLFWLRFTKLNYN